MAANSNNRQNVILGIVFILLGVVLAVSMVINLVNNSGTPADFSTLTEETIKSDMLVEGDIPYNFGNYETLYSETSSGYKETKGQYFMIQLSDGQLIGFYTSEAELINQLRQQGDVYYDLLTGAGDKEPEAIHFKGTVQEMDFEDGKIFLEYIGDVFGMTMDEVGDNSICLYIENNDNSEATPIFLVIGVVLAVLGLVFLIKGLRQRG